jgi:hypothetical protein
MKERGEIEGQIRERGRNNARERGNEEKRGLVPAKLGLALASEQIFEHSGECYL